MARYHDRLEVILKPKDYQRWLEESQEHQLPLDLLRPYPEEEMKSWRVSDKVGNVRNNWAELIESISEPDLNATNRQNALTRRKGRRR